MGVGKLKTPYISFSQEMSKKHRETKTTQIRGKIQGEFKKDKGEDEGKVKRNGRARGNAKKTKERPRVGTKTSSNAEGIQKTKGKIKETEKDKKRSNAGGRAKKNVTKKKDP